MRIALITAEYAPTTWRGGIGTYMVCLANMLADRGHEVEVFASLDRSFVDVERSNLITNFVACAKRDAFPALAAAAFKERHSRAPFDLIESSEFNAEAAPAAAVAPDVALVTKLHTSSAVGQAIHGSVVPAKYKARFIAGALVRLQRPRPYWKPNTENDPELALVRQSDEITSPTRAMIKFSEEVWKAHLGDVHLLPNVFRAPPKLLELPIAPKGGRVLYVGRLETRKGVIQLAQAIKRASRKDPGLQFTLVGRSTPQMETGRELIDVMKEIIGPQIDKVRFVGGVPYPELPPFFAAADVVILPSLWENFPNTCLESMAAGKAIIASRRGGMAEMIEDGRSGVLIDPLDTASIANKIVELAGDRARVAALGEAARERVLKEYGDVTIGPLHETSYRRALENAGRRSQLRTTELA